MSKTSKLKIKNHETTTESIIIGILTIIIVFGWFFWPETVSYEDLKKELAYEEIKQNLTLNELEKMIKEKEIEKAFSFWDGSHIKLTETIKESLDDPDSFEHEETVYWDQGDFLSVKMTYRANNSYGALTKRLIEAETDIKTGNIIEIISDTPYN